MPVEGTAVRPPTGRRPWRRPGRAGWAWVVAAVALAALLPVGWAHKHGSATSLLLVGRPLPDHPSRTLVMHDFTHVYQFHNQGHDGGMFYAMARRPFDFRTTARYLDYPAYRYRRILYPLVGRVLAPHGGTALIVALAAVSVLGVLLAALALTQFPNAPPWLPLAAAVNPGVMAALFLTLSDALTTGLVLAAYACMFRRRVWPAVLLAVLAVLTRETALVATLPLALWTGLPPRQRVALAATPPVAVAAWSLYAAHRVGQSISVQPRGGVLTWPLLGWLHGAPAGVADRLVSIFVVVVVLAAVARGSTLPPAVRAMLAASGLLLLCCASNVTDRSIDLTRVAAPAFPMALWALTRRSTRTAASPR